MCPLKSLAQTLDAHDAGQLYVMTCWRQKPRRERIDEDGAAQRLTIGLQTVERECRGRSMLLRKRARPRHSFNLLSLTRPFAPPLRQRFGFGKLGCNFTVKTAFFFLIE